jgi:hypothetical protein
VTILITVSLILCPAVLFAYKWSWNLKAF